MLQLVLFLWTPRSEEWKAKLSKGSRTISHCPFNHYSLTWCQSLEPRTWNVNKIYIRLYPRSRQTKRITKTPLLRKRQDWLTPMGFCVVLLRFLGLHSKTNTPLGCERLSKSSVNGEQHLGKNEPWTTLPFLYQLLKHGPPLLDWWVQSQILVSSNCKYFHLNGSWWEIYIHKDK